jgi:hypothetical protein
MTPDLPAVGRASPTAHCQGWERALADVDRLCFAAEVGATRLTLGVNTARHEAYRQLLTAGFRTDIPGVTMHRPNEPGYDREDVRLLDDWR